MKRLLITLSILVSFQVISADSTNYCAFIGSNTQTALQYTGNLISNLRKLKEETNCSVTDRSFQSLNDISGYFDFYLKNKSLETQIFKDQEQLEKLSEVLGDLTPGTEEYVSIKTDMITVKSRLIENEASLKISRDNQDSDYQKTNIQNLVMEISNVINDAYLYEGCFEKDPARAASIIGGMINLAGSVTALAGLNPLWAGVGKIVGNLTTQLGQAMRNYQWKYIEQLDKTALFFNMMCMIEMQSNFYCEKQTEVSLIKELMRLDFSGGNTSPTTDSVWEGMQIQSESMPVFQAWIKRLYLGAVPANPEDAAVLNKMIERISSAEGIISSVNAFFKKMLEDIEEGGDRYTLILNTTRTLSYLMTGYTGSEGGSSSTEIPRPGTFYFNNRYNALLMSYIIVAPPNVPVGNIPECPSASGCDRLIAFLTKYYGVNNNPPTSEEQFKMIIANMENNIKKITDAVSQDMDRDLLKRRLGDPGVLLAYSEIRDSVYDLSPREGLEKIYNYTKNVITTLRKYYDYRDTDEVCLDIKQKAGCPTPLQEAIKSRNILQRIIAILDDNEQEASLRITNLSDLLKFKDSKTLLLAPKLEIILKKDLEAKIKLGEITPIEDELIHLKRQNVLESLRQEGLENDKRKALDDRKRAMEVITYNLKSFIEIKPLRKSLLKEIKNIREDFENSKTYHESCAILLSTPYSNPDWGNGLEIVNICKNSKIVSSWNETRMELGLGVLPELDLDFNHYYKKEFPERVCAYNTYQKKNIIYGLKDKIKRRSL